MQLTSSQSAAVDKIRDGLDQRKPMQSLSGPAGSGKTTILSAIIEGLPDVEVCTPTNKAAQVLNAKGLQASTFFKKFFLLEEKKQRGVKPKFISCQRFLSDIAAAKGGHYRDYEHLLPEGKRAFADVIATDESSMNTSPMVASLRRMCNSLVMIGDRHQLPPVGDQQHPAGYFAQMNHDVELTEVLRQAEGSMILSLATELRLDSPKVKRALAYFEPQNSFESWVQDGAKMIVYTNKERQRINRVVRTVLGFDKPYPMPGDTMIVTNNFSDDLVNGTEVTVLEFEWNGTDPTALIRVTTGPFTLSTRMNMWAFIEDQVVSQQALLTEKGVRPFTDSELELDFLELTFGNTLTAHKAQGSEYACGVVFDQRGLIRKIAADNDRGGMSPDEVVRRWTYTAITRFKQQLAVAPTWWAAIPASLREEAA